MRHTGAAATDPRTIDRLNAAVQRSIRNAVPGATFPSPGGPPTHGSDGTYIVTIAVDTRRGHGAITLEITNRQLSRAGTCASGDTCENYATDSDDGLGWIVWKTTSDNGARQDILAGRPHFSVDISCIANADNAASSTPPLTYDQMWKIATDPHLDVV
jgi:hypothetical protein